MRLDFCAPGPARGLHQPLVAGAALIADGEALHDLQLLRTGNAGGRNLRVGLDLQIEDLFLLAAEHRQNAVRRQFVQRLAELEIIRKLLAFGLLALAHGRRQQAVRPHLLAQRADQVGVFAEALDQDGAGAVERRGDVGHLLLRIDEFGRGGLWIVLRLHQQQFGQRLQPGLLGDLRLGAALRLEREVDIFQPSLAVGSKDGGFERGVELALLAHRFQNGGTTRFQLAQVIQALLQIAQLRVVEPAGDFLAVPRHERHRGAAVEQGHGRLDLLLANAEFLRNLPVDVCHEKSF